MLHITNYCGYNIVVYSRSGACMYNTRLRVAACIAVQGYGQQLIIMYIHTNSDIMGTLNA